MHDFDAQKRDTEKIFAGIASRHAIPDQITLDIHFVPGDGAAWAAADRALQQAGFRVDAYAYENGPTLEARLAIENPTAETVWDAERLATETVLEHGFQPDGWGFAAPPEGGLIRGLASQVGRILRLS
jgi:hypothetical protein